MEDKMTAQLLDAAACDAVGALTPAESAAYQQDLAAADDPARKTDRELRETAARLAAASPHMTPPPDLRGRILQATAPATFRLEDYRKVTREDFRFYKWGFYAAACFLAAAALYNIQTKSSLTQALDKANAQAATLNQQRNQYAAAAQQRNDVIAAIINPRGVQVTWNNATGQPIGRGILDMSTHRALLIFPEETISHDTRPQLTLDIDGNKVPFQTSVITFPASQLGLAPTDLPNINVGNLMNVKNLTNDDTNKPKVAGFQP